MHGVQGTDGGEEFLVVGKGDSTSHLKIFIIHLNTNDTLLHYDIL